MTKTGNKITRYSRIVLFFLVACGWQSFGFAQTGNNWKIILSEPTKDPYWTTVGKTFSAKPKFNAISPEPGEQGSSVVIAEDLVLTVAHAIRKTRLNIVFGNVSYNANLIAIDLYNDRALLKLEHKFVGPFRKLRETPLREGEKFKSYGYGTKYGYHNVEFKDGLFFGDAYFGDSGGPIIDEKGEVIGVVSATSKDEVLNQTNIFNLGYESLVKWVNDNKNWDISAPVVTK
jgi:S1-C subfamily serine protease